MRTERIHMNETLYKKLRDIFSENGSLSRLLQGFEYRGEQLHMAEAVLDALISEKALIVEAGTGVGKSLAYLVPLCIWLSQEKNPRAIVSTYTKTLQKQLFEKELPFIKEHFFPHLRYALSFGSENYICLKRLAQSRQHGLFDVQETDGISLLTNWIKRTSTGLRHEIHMENAIWHKVRRESDICSGKKCRYFSDCFYQSAKTAERKANIVVSNHFLYFAHVASNYNVLPDAEYVVFDEAHEIADVASDYLGIEVSNYKLRHLLDTIISSKGKGLLLKLTWLTPGQLQELSAVVDGVRRKGEEFFQEIQDVLGAQRSIRFQSRPDIGIELFDALYELNVTLEKLGSLSSDEEEQQEILAITHRGLLFLENLKNIYYQEYDDHVYWASMENRIIRFIATPLNIAEILRERVFNTLTSAVLTSATLSVNREFDFVKNRLGLQDAESAFFSSPFDFREQAAVYIPGDMPAPNDREFPGAVAEEVERILQITKGNTMVLFTSYSLLHDVVDRIHMDYPVLKQGDRDNFLLLEAFKERQPSVLFGTYTFWQGIDLQGEVLKCVVITKLPFSVPTEPLVEARMEQIAAHGKDPFYEYQVPNAVITFKQGFGRLIRASSDKGIIAVLDSRIMRKTYGRHFFRSLPDIHIVQSISEVKRFLNSD